MAEVRWTPQAADDIETIAEFIAQDSPYYAALFVMNILQAADRMAEFPQTGRIVPEINDAAIRETILGNYRMIYRLRANVVEILTVYHGARLLDPQKLN